MNLHDVARKACLPLGALLALAAAPACQADTSVSVGLKAGCRVEANHGLSIDQTMVGSPSGGFFTEIHKDRFQLRPGIETFRRNYVFDEPNYLPGGRVDIHHHEWSMQYTELPLMMSFLVYDGLVQPALILGIRPTIPGFGVEGQIASDRAVEKDYYPYNNWWIGWSAGLGCDVPLGPGKLVLEGRWDVDYAGTRKDAAWYQAGAWRLQAGYAFTVSGGKGSDKDEGEALGPKASKRQLKALRRALSQLKAMRDEGLISQAQYTERRAILMGSPATPATPPVPEDPKPVWPAEAGQASGAAGRAHDAAVTDPGKKSEAVIKFVVPEDE